MRSIKRMTSPGETRGIHEGVSMCTLRRQMLLVPLMHTTQLFISLPESDNLLKNRACDPSE